VAYQDMIMDGYDNEKRKFVRAMIDNHLNTGILFLEGTYYPATKSIIYLGEAPGASPGKKNTMHVLVTILDQDHYREEWSVESDGGWESGVTESNYTMLRPLPFSLLRQGSVRSRGFLMYRVGTDRIWSGSIALARRRPTRRT
jgi:hypothetical protein